MCVCVCVCVLSWFNMGYRTQAIIGQLCKDNKLVMGMLALHHYKMISFIKRDFLHYL